MPLATAFTAPNRSLTDVAMGSPSVTSVRLNAAEHLSRTALRAGSSCSFVMPSVALWLLSSCRKCTESMHASLSDTLRTMLRKMGSDQLQLSMQCAAVDLATRSGSFVSAIPMTMVEYMFVIEALRPFRSLKRLRAQKCQL